MLTNRKLHKIIEKFSKDATDRGLAVTAGWNAFRKLVMAPDAPEDQVREMQIAFYSGAQHLFSTLNSILEEGAEPTENDMRRMTLISEELGRFTLAMSAELMQTKGRA